MTFSRLSLLWKILIPTLLVMTMVFAITGWLGFSYSAKFDGKDYPVMGTNSLDSVVLKRINDWSVQETLKYKGKVKARTD